VKLVYAPRARQQIERALKWWRENRPLAPTLLADELDEYLDKLLETPHLGEPWGERGGVEIRKVLLPRTKKKLFVMRPEPDVVRIVCFWGGQRGRDPKL
jgi:plasmid stabilization system protein ParE